MKHGFFAQTYGFRLGSVPYTVPLFFLLFPEFFVPLPNI